MSADFTYSARLGPSVLARVPLNPREAPWLEGLEEEFSRYVAEKLELDPIGVSARIDDLALLFGCVRLNASALAAFRDRVLSRLRSPLDDADLQQKLLERLFLPTEGVPPRALRYQARGSLFAWVRTVAQNLMQSFHRGEVLMVDLAEDMATAPGGPEETYLEQESSRHFASALRNAVARLAPRDRAILRLHSLDGRSVQEIARAFDVHRETAGLWLEAARRRIATETIKELRLTLGLSPHGADAIVQAAVAAGDGSVARLLAADPTPVALG